MCLFIPVQGNVRMSRCWSRHMSTRLFSDVIICKIVVVVCHARGFRPCLSRLLSEIQLNSPPKILSSVGERYADSVRK